MPQNQTSSTGVMKPGARIRRFLQDCFEKHWNQERKRDSKLKCFYNKCKKKFGVEAYIAVTQKKYKRSLAQIRMSSHKLHIETGRYRAIPRHERLCRGCISTDTDVVEGFLALPECILPVEDEIHTLFECSYYTDVRKDDDLDSLQNAMKKNPTEVFSDTSMLKRFGKLASAVLKKHHSLIHKTDHQK